MHDREYQINTLLGGLGLFPDLVQSFVVPARRGPHAVLQALVDVVLVG